MGCDLRLINGLSSPEIRFKLWNKHYTKKKTSLPQKSYAKEYASKKDALDLSTLIFFFGKKQMLIYL